MRAIQESFVPIIGLRCGQSKVEVGSTLPLAVSDSESAANFKTAKLFDIIHFEG